MKKYLPILACFVCYTIFGFTFYFVKIAMDIVGGDTFRLLSIRFVISVLFMTLLWVFGAIKMKFSRKTIAPLILIGFLNPVGYYVFETYGIAHSPTSQAGIMIAVIPIVATILGAIFLKEYPSRLQWLFVVMGIAGVGVINVIGGQIAVNLTGFLLMLGAVLMGSIHNCLTKKVILGYTPFEVTYIMMLVGASTFTTAAIIQRAVTPGMAPFFQGLLTWPFISSILFLAIMASVVAFVLFNYSMSRLPIVTIVSFNSLCTVISIVAGAVLLNERYTIIDFMGTVLILGGITGVSLAQIKADRDKENREGTTNAAAN